MRYEVIEESASGHCCFEASVIDNATRDCCGDVDSVCETFDVADAKKIAKLLNTDNAALPQKKKEKEVWKQFRIDHPTYAWEVWCLYSIRMGKYQVWELESVGVGLPLAEYVMSEEGKAYQLWTRIKGDTEWRYEVTKCEMSPYYYVVDTTMDDLDVDRYVCECLVQSNADFIADALNNATMPLAKKEKYVWRQFAALYPSYECDVWCHYCEDTGTYKVWQLEGVNEGLPYAEFVTSEDGKVFQLWSRVK